MHLYQVLDDDTRQWREAGYPCEEFPAIAEILEYQIAPETRTAQFLRTPQLQALETYWYLRLQESTPHVFDLYQKLFPKRSELLAALGLDRQEIKDFLLDNPLDDLWDNIRTDDEFVRHFRLEALRETLSLRYPSYILALAMGAGKTILIGAIIATEFGMAIEYPSGPFVQNALVFAPGKTIIESLRELADVPYQQVLPPRLYKPFAATFKLQFTRDGEKDIPVIRGSSFNVVVTNTEKIRIQKETIRKSDLGQMVLNWGQQDKAREEIANLRLQAIGSLPHLAIFSDEAHHTYGQSLDTELKKVRKTVDYLATNTNVICTVNTTGTPYYQRQPLKDVVVWYGLSEGIRDGILKDVGGNIQSYSFDGNAAGYVSHVIKDFFRDYGQVSLANGAPAKLAMYFPQTDDLAELKPIIEQALLSLGQSPSICLVNTSDDKLTKQADIDAFNRLNDPRSPHRVILLVNKGTEGWNCPSLFACALVRSLRTSNNFVLQASTRCMRQVSGNRTPARIYLSTDNFGILDRQLQETYGETISDLNRAAQESRRCQIALRKLHIPPLVVTREVRTVERGSCGPGPITLRLPDIVPTGGLTRRDYKLGEQKSTYSVLQQVGNAVTIDTSADLLDRYSAAVDISARYRLDQWAVYDELVRLYPSGDVPAAHLDDLAAQIEVQTRSYTVRVETVEVALALVKPEGFRAEIDPAGARTYVADIVYPKDREHLLLSWEELRRTDGSDFGFHYTPYNFDSNPEKSFFEQILNCAHTNPSEVEDVYFTGALTTPDKTDFYVEYRGEDGKPHRYTPDFVIRRKDGKVLIVEIKSAQFEASVKEDLARGGRGEPILTVEGRKAIALRAWENLAPERLKYQIIFAAGDTVAHDHTATAREFTSGGGK